MLTVEAVGGTAPYSYLWDNGGEEAHITGATGGYAVTITDANGCVLQVSGLSIGAGQGPVAAFSHGPGPVVVGTPVEFTNNSIDMQSSTWDFGDGNGSTEPDPTHTYTMAGIYTVTLTVNNGDCTDSWSTEVVVELSTGLEDIGPTGITSWAADDQLFLDHDLEGGMMQVELLDVAGKLHHQWSVGAMPGRVSFPMAGLSAGVWVVRVIHDGAQHTFRVPLVR
ncbi:MAG: PKD domain-containing protein [Flavobacteriales bacterium]|nr:PKD domain-containing protein [Flavobacteriales bacterium]